MSPELSQPEEGGEGGARSVYNRMPGLKSELAAALAAEGSTLGMDDPAQVEFAAREAYYHMIIVRSGMELPEDPISSSEVVRQTISFLFKGKDPTQ